ncbi:hypothetical protein [Streptobacillus canis]|uniref:hypothetical protein n=1 Tax=Streptobacillus canis TaxID=2678686 RepID=UPI0012E2E1E6|nr:hypothetical protein [Streptobacillus canis]
MSKWIEPKNANWKPLINLDSVKFFCKYEDYDEFYIRFNFGGVGLSVNDTAPIESVDIDISFDTEEERDKEYERIKKMLLEE